MNDALELVSDERSEKENVAPPPPPPRGGGNGGRESLRPLSPREAAAAQPRERRPKLRRRVSTPAPPEEASPPSIPAVAAGDPLPVVVEVRQPPSLQRIPDAQEMPPQQAGAVDGNVDAQHGGPILSEGGPQHSAVALRSESSGEAAGGGSPPQAALSANSPQLVVTLHSASPVGPNNNIVHPFVRIWLLSGLTGENLAIPVNPNFGPEACCTTFPYDIRSRMSRAPIWEQAMAFYLKQAALEPHKDPTLFFELLDFGFHSIDGLVVRERLYGGAPLYNIAWGFLKLFPRRHLAAGEQPPPPSVLNTQFGQKLHIQMFQYPERTSAVRHLLNAMTPSFLAHTAATAPAAVIATDSVVPYVFKVFADRANRTSPYPLGLSVTVTSCMAGDFDPTAPPLCTAYEEALEGYLWQAVGGREKGERRNLPPTQALEVKSKAASKFAKSDFTRRRDERSLPPSAVLHEASVHGKITAVALCPFNRLLAVASTSNFTTTIQMFDILNPMFSTVACLRGHADLIHSMNFNADATQLASASSDKTVKVWDISQLPRIVNSTEDELAVCLATFSHGFSAYGVVFAANVLVVGGYDTRLHVYPTPEPGHRPHPHPFYTAQHSTTAFFQFLAVTDRTKIWAIDSLYNLMMWRIELDDNDEFHSLSMRRRVECPGASAASICGNVVAVTCPSENVMLLVDANSFSITHRIFTGKRTAYVPTCVLPDGCSVVVGTSTGRLLVWETKTGELCSSREGSLKGLLRFPVELLAWGTNHICVMAQAYNPETAQGRIAVLGRPRREADVVKTNDPRAGDLIRSLFGGEVNLRSTRPEAIPEQQQPTTGTDDPPRHSARAGDAATRMEQIMSYWNALVKKRGSSSLSPSTSQKYENLELH